MSLTTDLSTRLKKESQKYLLMYGILEEKVVGDDTHLILNTDQVRTVGQTVSAVAIDTFGDKKSVPIGGVAISRKITKDDVVMTDSFIWNCLVNPDGTVWVSNSKPRMREGKPMKSEDGRTLRTFTPFLAAGSERDALNDLRDCAGEAFAELLGFKGVSQPKGAKS